MNISENQIKKIIPLPLYLRGQNYPLEYINFIEKSKIGSTEYYEFEVESETFDDYYEVTIAAHKEEFSSAYCTCPAYERIGECKHIAAVLINFDDFLTETLNDEEKILKRSIEILKEFYKEPKERTLKLKKQITLEIELEFHNNYSPSVTPRFRIGINKLYSLNNKLNNFLNAYETQKTTYELGKDFTYDKDEHFFNETDQNIINYLLLIKRNNPYYNMNMLSIPLERINDFLNILKNKTFYIKGAGLINKITNGCPFKMNLTKEKELYKLSVKEQDIEFIDKFYKYIKQNETLYILPEKISHILLLMNKHKLKEIIFKKDDLELFTSGILSNIKTNVQIDKQIESEITIGVKPEVKIYLDLKGNLITAEVKLTYLDTEINIFDKTPTIIRDNETENEILKTLLEYNFQIENEKIYMEDLENIGDFLTGKIDELLAKYEIYTSNKIKETNILKEANIKSSFSIGTDNILKYEFDLGTIKNDEIINILETLKSKKKYYKLKSGDILNLTEAEDLKEFDNLVNEMELSNKDIKETVGTIPKYRAIYLDSIKKEKYHIIKTNNLFDELINNFNSYKNKNITLSNKDTKILRDYQITGVKWLYNIHKCGFGGILADEMGLGKSIQLIYFIKQIIKEKKEAKILIIAPTSLIYNWKNEFDKFGNELNYKVYAENKEKRHQELENIGNTNILITTYGLIRQDKEEYLRMNFEIIAIDEAQNIKNSNAGMTKVIKELKGTTKIALTGTPLENTVLELWSIFDFIMPGYLTNLASFSRKYNIKDVEKDDLKMLNNLNKQIKPFILRRKKKDVVKELPDKIENNIYIELTKEQKKIYVGELEKTKIEMEKIIEEEGFKKGSFKILQLLTKLRQLCIDPKIIYEDYKGGSSKIEELIKLTEGIIKNGHKILLFSSYKTAIDIVNREFTNHKISTYVIDGSVPSKKRMELVENFNNDDTNVFLITLKSGGTGLNLTSADVVIHLDLWWNPQVENQATDRAHRIGQKNTVEVIKLICKGTIEERILELQNKKKALSDNLIEGKDRDQNIISKLTEKDIKNLLSIDNEEND